MKQNILQVLIVTIGDNRYGIDIDQIACLTNVDTAKSTVRFEQLLLVDPAVQCNYSKMLLIKQQIGTPILICEPDEVMTISIGDICSLPEILMITAGNKGIWGFIPQEGGVIILIDFYKNQQFMRLARNHKKI